MFRPLRIRPVISEWPSTPLALAMVRLQSLSFEAQFENVKARRAHECSLHIEDPQHLRKAEEASSGPPTLSALTSQNVLNADSYVLSQGGMLLRVSWLRTVVITNSGFF